MKRRHLSASRRFGLLLRFAAISAAAAAVTAVLAGLVCDAAAPVVTAVHDLGPDSVVALPLGDVLAALAGVAVLGCWTVVVTHAAVVGAGAVWQVLRHGRLRPSAPTSPADGGRCWTRRAVLAALGLSLGAGPLLAGPATADAPGRPTPEAAVASAPLAGLPVPDRTSGSRVPRLSAAEVPGRSTLTVRPGDSLWRIATRLAGPHASPGPVADCWRQLLRANADRVGADPDLIFPGTSLLAPRCDRPRKD